MGLFDKVFGKKEEFPALSEASPTAGQIEQMKQPLEKLASEVSDPLEIVPTDNAAYAFIGKPPKKFGIAWVDADGKIRNFKSLVDEKGLAPITIEKLSSRMREAYLKGEEAKRYSATIAGREVVVTASTSMASEIEKIIQEYTA